MNFKVEQLDRATIFRPNEKRLDSVIASELKAEFLILAQPDVKTLVLDLSGVEYIDSAGLSALLLAQRQQSHHHGDMRLAGASEEVRSLLSLTALDRVFPMYNTVEEALAAPQLSLISVPPGDIRPATEALKNGMKIASAAVGAAAIAELMMSDGGEEALPLGGEDDAFDDDDEYDDDLEDDDDELVDDEDGIEPEVEEEEVAATDDELAESIDDEDIEEIEEDDLVEAEDLDLNLDEEDDEEDDLI